MMLFIVNPNSGAKKDAVMFAALIKKHFTDAKIEFTERGGHAIELAAKAVQEGYSRIIACGGDGTINEVARALKNTNTALGIVPRGSGNGFAREIGMSLNNETALIQLKTAKSVLCDMGKINDDLFINLAGVGIEADIAHAFATHGTRGKLPYFWLGAKIFFTYKPRTLRVIADGKEAALSPLTLVFANGRQYGSNFKIAPDASLTDGALDMVQVLNKNFFRLLAALPAFFTSLFKPLGATVCQTVKHVQIYTAGPVNYHVDGEPKQSVGEVVDVEIIPACINILVAK